ncbi:universal stress protein [Magnetovibrio sp. PR-2]|uniref:universal stress protein n=1 Tax=Magnetovibrio sp. PR-2 TaxID=3120356 RepID=UPI002FCDE5BF
MTDDVEDQDFNDPERPHHGRFRILVCIDGSDESYRGLRYAAKIATGHDVDIVMCYVRPVDQGLRTGGLQMDVARGNILDWGLELPGIKYLKKGRKLLMELGNLKDHWEEQSFHTDVAGTSLGDNKIEYTGRSGKKVVLKLKVANDIVNGILEQWELGHYDLIIMGASARWDKRSAGRAIRGFFDPAVAEKIATHAPCSVLLARDLEIGHGHLVCTDGSELSTELLTKEAYIASLCECPVSLITVVSDVESKAKGEKVLAEAVDHLDQYHVHVKDRLVRIGDPIDEIIEAGPEYSLLVVADGGKSGLERFFVGSVAQKVIQGAHNSVMIVR